MHVNSRKIRESSLKKHYADDELVRKTGHSATRVGEVALAHGPYRH